MIKKIKVNGKEYKIKLNFWTEGCLLKPPKLKPLKPKPIIIAYVEMDYRDYCDNKDEINEQLISEYGWGWIHFCLTNYRKEQ